MLVCCNRPAIRYANTNGFRVCQDHLRQASEDAPEVTWGTEGITLNSRCDFRINSHSSIKERYDYRRPNNPETGT